MSERALFAAPVVSRDLKEFDDKLNTLLEKLQNDDSVIRDIKFSTTSLNKDVVYSALVLYE